MFHGASAAHGQLFDKVLPSAHSADVMSNYAGNVAIFIEIRAEDARAARDQKYPSAAAPALN
jgi:hypothetical protein